MAATDLPLLVQPKISDEVYKVLEEKIFSKQFVPGERLNLLELEKRLGISRTPLKDALNRLAGEGLIIIEPHRGSYRPGQTVTSPGA
jgi:DNA-binding GntR family transcriptional regulator